MALDGSASGGHAVRSPPVPGGPRTLVLSGSTRRPSKSRALGEAIAARLVGKVFTEIEVLDLVDAGSGLGAAFTRDALDRRAGAVVDAVERADALVVVTPVHKAAYPGLFKHLMDLVDPGALIDKPVVIGATGGGHRHALVPEHQLRPLFGFFSAATVATSIYAAEGEFVDGRIADPAVLDRIELAASQLAAVLCARGAPARGGAMSHATTE